MKKMLYIVVTFAITGCSGVDKQEEATVVSCLIEDYRSGEISMCFEGELEFVKPRCQQPNEIDAPKVTFSTTKGCPTDRENYLGRCNINNGEYVPFSYAGTSPYLDSEKIKMMEEMTKEGCIDNHNGQWVK